MENAKISRNQLFILIVLLELGSALLVPTAIEAKQDAWLAILIAMGGGLFLFSIYLYLFQQYPDIPLTEYLPVIFGKAAGRFLAFLYVLYFTYIASRLLRTFGEMLSTIAYRDTPIIITNLLFICVVMYAVRKGIEVLARAGELFFIFLYLLAISGFILIVVSGLIELNQLRPILEEGFMPVLKSAFTQTLYYPFGEVIVFAMILPYLNHPKQVKITSMLALGLSGINLAIVMVINISVIGVDLTVRSPYPLLSTIQSIQIAKFLERLDVYFMFAMIIGGFFKISLYLYAAAVGAANLFRIKESARLVFPLGFVILIMSLSIASNSVEHKREGVELVTVVLHLPFQVIIPLLLLIVIFLKKRYKNGAMAKGDKEHQG
ncbi:GerAB/ArcD/ProY family transporter [Niallia oryzisoli]|uniref:GerAB/ArcD/ProY family transporter n=1 Tax=Niallia oryzisoli TaxID=1737571 RepID=A0ABZ2CCM6_9BACI